MSRQRMEQGTCYVNDVTFFYFLPEMLIKHNKLNEFYRGSLRSQGVHYPDVLGDWEKSIFANMFLIDLWRLQRKVRVFLDSQDRNASWWVWVDWGWSYGLECFDIFQQSLEYVKVTVISPQVVFPYFPTQGLI